jgi:hypothetical protein
MSPLPLGMVAVSGAASINPALISTYSSPQPRAAAFGAFANTYLGYDGQTYFRTSDGVTMLGQSTLEPRREALAVNSTHFIQGITDTSYPGKTRISTNGFTWTEIGNSMFRNNNGQIISWADQTYWYSKDTTSTNQVLYQSLTSPAGLLNTSISSSNVGLIWSATKNNNNEFLITCNSDNNNRYITQSGLSFTTRIASASMQGRTTWDGQKWVGAAEGNIFTTTSAGTLPTFTSHGLGTQWNSVVFGGGLYIMTSGDTSLFYASQNLTTWTGYSIPSMIIGGRSYSARIKSSYDIYSVFMSNINKFVIPVDYTRTGETYPGYALVG